jgi:hypothetical protein
VTSRAAYRALEPAEATPALAARTPGAAAYDVSPPAACVTHQQSEHFHRFQSGIVVGPAINNDAIHHKKLSRLHRLFDNLESLIKEREQSLAMRREQLRDALARPRRVRFPCSPMSAIR